MAITSLSKTYNHVQKLSSCSGNHKQYKTLFKDHIARLKIISLYIYKDLRLKTWNFRSNESREHYREDGNLVPIPRYGFSFEAAFQL